VEDLADLNDNNDCLITVKTRGRIYVLLKSLKYDVYMSFKIYSLNSLLKYQIYDFYVLKNAKYYFNIKNK